jgi:AbrB family looped-hinge helix DNA binding protein
VNPAEIRNQLGIEPGDTLVIRAEDGRVIIEKREQIPERLRNWFSHIPADVSLVDELIAVRRAEAAREVDS